MSPGLYGVEETRGGRSARTPVSRPRNPSVSISMIGRPVNVSASAADGSSSSGTRSPATETDSLSQARWSSSLLVNRSPCARARRASEIRMQGSHCHLEPRRHQVPPGPRGVDGPGGGGERGAEARPAVPHGQAVHLQLPDRDEPEQLAIPGPQSGWIERHLEPPEGQLERAAL